MSNATKGFPIESEIVQSLGSIYLSGDIVPPEFFNAIRFESGKPDLLSVLILADLLYWFRPIRPRSEDTGQALAWRQKFKGESLNREYGYFENKFGATNRQCRDSVARLKNLGLIFVAVIPRPSGGSCLAFSLNLENILTVLKNPDSRLNVSRVIADSRLNVSRLTFKRESSINTIDYKETKQQQYSKKAKIAAAAFSESHASRLEFSEILSWVLANKKDAKNPKGLARTIWRDGSDDIVISAWLAQKSENEAHALKAIENEKNKMLEAQKQAIERIEYAEECRVFISLLSASDYKARRKKAFDVLRSKSKSIRKDSPALDSAIESEIFRQFCLNELAEFEEVGEETHAAKIAAAEKQLKKQKVSTDPTSAYYFAALLCSSEQNATA